MVHKASRCWSQIVGLSDFWILGYLLLVSRTLDTRIFGLLDYWIIGDRKRETGDWRVSNE
jgi:hypothetical protein